MIFLKLRGPLDNMGYVDMTFEFPKDVVGVAINIPTLLLVVPDVHPEKSCFSLEPIFLMSCINYSRKVEMESIILN